METIIVGGLAFVAGGFCVFLYQGKSVNAAVADMKSVLAKEWAAVKTDVSAVKTKVGL
jgi:hypothetical protein